MMMMKEKKKRKKRKKKENIEDNSQHSKHRKAKIKSSHQEPFHHHTFLISQNHSEEISTPLVPLIAIKKNLSSVCIACILHNVFRIRKKKKRGHFVPDNIIMIMNDTSTGKTYLICIK